MKLFFKVFVGASFFVALCFLIVGWMIAAVNNALGWDTQGAIVVFLYIALAGYFIYVGVYTIKNILGDR